MSVPQPPSSTPTNHTAPGAPPSGEPAADGGRKFGATPVGTFVAMVVAVAVGVVTYVLTSSATVVAMCGSERMGPGDTCETTRRGVSTGFRSYTEVLAEAQRMNQVGQWVGIGLVVIGVVFLVLTFVRWRQDVETRSRLGSEHGTPLSAHSKTASSSLLLLIVGTAFVGGAIYCLLAGLARDQWPWFIGTAIAGAIGIAILATAVPGNGQLVQVYEQGVRVVSNRTISDVAWRDVSYQIVPAKNAANHSISGPGIKGSVALGALTDAERLQGVAQQRSVQARYRPALEAINRGETVAFGQLGVSREGISTGRKVLPWSEYGGIALNQGQVTVAKHPQGRFATITLGQVHNYALLVHVVDAVVKQQPR